MPPLHLETNVPSPQLVGTSITLLPRADDGKPGENGMPGPGGPPPPPNDRPPGPGGPPPNGGPSGEGGRPKLTFRYSVSVNGGPSHVISDYSKSDVFVWTPALYEQEAKVKVEVREGKKEPVTVELPFQIVSRIKNSQPVVTPTAHPLVALFSAPPCPAGQQFRVAFRPVGGNEMNHTSPQDCRGTVSQNIYVAGMQADTPYEMRPEVLHGSQVEAGTWLPYHTGMIDSKLPPIRVTVPRSSADQGAEPLLISASMEPWPMVATDGEGHVIWYGPDSSFLTRVLPDGHFLALADGNNSENDMKRTQLVREFDLAGHTVRETNISRVADQLTSRGISSSCKKGSSECVPGFHHEAIRLPNGHTLAMAGLERMLPSPTGSKEKVDILGDLIIDLDEDFQVTWMWNSFDHLDVKRASLGKEKCREGAGDDGCTPVFLAHEAEGWLHSNSLAYMPATGDLLVSMPEQDWVIKVDYKDGKGSGNVLWRLGAGGDFTARSDDPNPWFSYQHDVRLQPGTTDMISLLDDGRRRKEKNPQANNRGQVWKIDEKTKTASLVYNADLGVFSAAVGSAQQLTNGNYSFEAGLINPGPALYSEAIETSPEGKVVYAQRLDGLTYRSFRVADLYTPPAK